MDEKGALLTRRVRNRASSNGAYPGAECASLACVLINATAQLILRRSWTVTTASYFCHATPRTTRTLSLVHTLMKQCDLTPFPIPPTMMLRLPDLMSSSLVEQPLSHPGNGYVTRQFRDSALLLNGAVARTFRYCADGRVHRSQPRFCLLLFVAPPS